MAPRSRTDDRRASSAPNMAPVFAAIGVVVIAALGVAVMTAENKEQQAAPETASDAPTDEAIRDAGASAFGDIDTSPAAVARGGGKRTDRAPAGIADSPAFTEGRALAAAGRELVAAALAARKAGDEETYNTQASAARDKYERAMEITADWEIELISKYGSDDRQVAKIGKEIDGWRKQLNKVRKAR